MAMCQSRFLHFRSFLLVIFCYFVIVHSAVKMVIVWFSVMSQNVVYLERLFLPDNTLPTLSGLVQD